MSLSRFHALLLSLTALMVLDQAPPKAAPNEEGGAPPKATELAMAKLPVRFEANAGQFDDHVRFVARKGGTSLALRDDGAVLTVHPPRPRVEKGERGHER